jgi:hypothetical protein
LPFSIFSNKLITVSERCSQKNEQSSINYSEYFKQQGETEMPIINRTQFNDNKTIFFPTAINPNILQNIMKPVIRSVKSIILATLMTVFFSSAMAILGGTSQVYANPLQSLQANNHQIKDVITSRASMVGKWKGYLYPQGDDTSTSVEIVINPGASQQGTWKFIGEDDSAFDSGTVVASLSLNNATLEFKQKNNKPSWFFKCQIQNNNKLSGEQVGNTNWKLTLNKTN